MTRSREGFRLTVLAVLCAGSAFSNTILLQGNSENAVVGAVGVDMPQAVVSLAPEVPLATVPQTQEFRLRLFMPAGDLTPFANLASSPFGLDQSAPPLNPTIDYRSAALEPAGYRAQEVQHMLPTLILTGTPGQFIDPWQVTSLETPEPGTLLLLGCGLAAVAWRLRRVQR